jgi:hypothetical protein
MLDCSSALTWTATPLAISLSETLASPGATVWKSSPLDSLPAIALLPLAPVAMVTLRTLPSSAWRTN